MVNDHNHALADLKDQLPDHVRKAIWPTRKAIKSVDSLPDGSASGGDVDAEADDNDSSVDQIPSISTPGNESPSRKQRQRDEEERRRREEQEHGIGM